MADLDKSILNSTKKILGFEAEYTAFDLDITTHINSVFFTLHQLGVGPDEGFMITGADEVWADYVGLNNINAVKSYLYLKVRLLFDPPSTSFAIEAMNKQASEMEWRLNVHMEGVRYSWSDPLMISSPTTE